MKFKLIQRKQQFIVKSDFINVIIGKPKYLFILHERKKILS